MWPKENGSGLAIRLISLYADQGIEIRAQIPLGHLPEVRAGLIAGGLSGELVIENRRLPLQLADLPAKWSAAVAVSTACLSWTPATSPRSWADHCR
jgi:hypothetical protein